jgi:hypothetical protein
LEAHPNSAQFCKLLENGPEGEPKSKEAEAQWVKAAQGGGAPPGPPAIAAVAASAGEALPGTPAVAVAAAAAAATVNPDADADADVDASDDDAQEPAQEPAPEITPKTSRQEQAQVQTQEALDEFIAENPRFYTDPTLLAEVQTRQHKINAAEAETKAKINAARAMPSKLRLKWDAFKAPTNYLEAFKAPTSYLELKALEDEADEVVEWCQVKCKERVEAITTVLLPALDKEDDEDEEEVSALQAELARLNPNHDRKGKKRKAGAGASAAAGGGVPAQRTPAVASGALPAHFSHDLASKKRSSSSASLDDGGGGGDENPKKRIQLESIVVQPTKLEQLEELCAAQAAELESLKANGSTALA